MTTEEKARELVRQIRAAKDIDAERIIIAAIRAERAAILSMVEEERDLSYRVEKMADSRPSGYRADGMRDMAIAIKDRDTKDFHPQA